MIEALNKCFHWAELQSSCRNLKCFCSFFFFSVVWDWNISEENWRLTEIRVIPQLCTLLTEALLLWGRNDDRGKKEKKHSLEEDPGCSLWRYQRLVYEQAAYLEMGPSLQLEGKFGSWHSFWDDASHPTGDTRYS